MLTALLLSAKRNSAVSLCYGEFSCTENQGSVNYFDIFIFIFFVF